MVNPEPAANPAAASLPGSDHVAPQAGAGGTAKPLAKALSQPKSPGVADLSGRQLGEFRLLRRLGRGGMAEVYLAEQTSLSRQVALKMLRPEFVTDPTYLKRFQHEAAAAGGLNHPNIVQVYMIGEEEGIHFIAQEYVQGRNLKEFLQKKGPLELTPTLQILRQIAQALTVAGDAGIVHRDIKPENILLNRRGEVKVADFGLAQLNQGEKRVALTQEGVTMGTPLYMSPEQVRGKQVDCRSDLYSFGVMAYHMLAARPPFQGETALAIAVQHLNEVPPPLAEKRPDLPAVVCQFVHRLMAKNKDDRPADANAVLVEIKQLIRQSASKEGIPTVSPAAKRRGSSPAPRSWHTSVMWLSLAAFGTLAASAGVGWITRTGDPLLAPAHAAVRVPKQATAQGQYFFALSLGNQQDAWQAVLEYWGSDPNAKLECMRAEMRLGLIALSNGQLEEAKTLFDRFTAEGQAGEHWKRVHGLAGLAVLASLEGNAAASRELIYQLEKVDPVQRKIDAAMGVALEEAKERNGRTP